MKRTVGTAVVNAVLVACSLSMAASSFAAGGSLFENAARFQDVLATNYLRGDQDAARDKARALQATLPEDDAVRAALVAENLVPVDGQPPSPGELAFATGTKEEYYCRAQGLVMAEGHHADGSFSRLVLVSSDRKMEPDQYAVTADGSQWIYELSNSFRQPVRSEIWQTWGRPKGFNLFEVRRLPDGFDQGNWDYAWDDGKFTSRHSINGNAVEPVRSLFMATQYHLWGSVRLGYDLKFEVGYQDTNFLAAQGQASGRIPLKSSRTVTEHLPKLSYQDSTGKTHDYEDCFRVDMRIEYDPQQARPEPLRRQRARRHSND